MLKRTLNSDSRLVDRFPEIHTSNQHGEQSLTRPPSPISAPSGQKRKTQWWTNSASRIWCVSPSEFKNSKAAQPKPVLNNSLPKLELKSVNANEEEKDTNREQWLLTQSLNLAHNFATDENMHEMRKSSLPSIGVQQKMSDSPTRQMSRKTSEQNFYLPPIGHLNHTISQGSGEQGFSSQMLQYALMKSMRSKRNQ